MNIADLAGEIFDALQEFDRLSAPFGLYAAGDLAGAEPHKQATRGQLWEQWKKWKIARDHPEWEGALQGVFERRNRELKVELSGSASFELPSQATGHFEIKRLSKIKVRQYGSKYHVDKHENFSQRWNEMRMDKSIADLWSSLHNDVWNSRNTNVHLRLLLLLGFAKATRPFERELQELKPHPTRASHGIEFWERTWDDPVGRGFKIKAALWAHRTESNTGNPML